MFNHNHQYQKRASLFPSHVLNGKLLIMDFLENPVQFIVLKFIHQLPKSPRYLHFELFIFVLLLPYLSFVHLICLYEDLPCP